MINVKMMSFNDILRIFGLSLDLNYMNRIITDSKIFQDFAEEAMENKYLTNFEYQTKLQNFLKQHAKYIDNEAFVFYTLKTIIEKERGGYYKEIADKCKDALRDSDMVCIEPNPKAFFNDDEIIVTTAQNLIGNRHESKQELKSRESVEKLSKQIDLDELFTANSNIEIGRNFGKNVILNGLIVKLNFIDVLSKVTRLSLDEKRFLLGNNADSIHKLESLVQEHKEQIKNLDETIFFSNTIKYLKKYPQYFDIDAILLIAACRAHEYLENTNLDDEEEKMFIRILNVAKDNIQNHSKEVSNIKSGVNDGVLLSFNYKDLSNACKRITENNYYLDEKEENTIRNSLIYEDDISQLVPESLRIMPFSEDEYKRMMRKSGVFYFFVSNELLNNHMVRKMLQEYDIEQSDVVRLLNEDFLSSNYVKLYLQEKKKISEELFDVIEEKDLFSARQKLEFYINGCFSLNVLGRMSEKSRNEISGLLSSNTLMSLYRNNNRSDEYLFYSAVFRDIMILNKDKKEKIEVGDELICALGNDFEEDDLIEMYKQHLICIENVKSWAGDTLIIDMMKNALLRPTDVKDICNDGDYNCILEIMRDPTIAKRNKLAIFYSTFSQCGEKLSEEQIADRENARKKCLTYMNFLDKNTEHIKKHIGEKKIGEKIKKRKEFVTDPLIRWNLIGLLDPEYSYEILDQGMMIFKLPNLKRGTIILEKMFRKDKIHYGRATKILNMPIEEFEELKKELIVKGDIPVFVIESNSQLIGRVNSLDHVISWGQNLADYFEYKTDERRSKESIERIDDEIQRIVRSRKVRD